MTKEQKNNLIESLIICSTNENGCEGCIYRGLEKCRIKLVVTVVDLIKTMEEPAAPGLTSEIMGHYKKPLVNISFQEMEDGES